MKEQKIEKKLINQAEYARRLGVSRTYVALVLDGKRTGPRAKQLMEKIINFHNKQVVAA